MSKKVVIATIRSLGDLHPFIATAKALKNLGYRPIMAVPKNYVEKVHSADLEAYPVFPGFDELSRSMGMSEEQFVKRLMADIDFMFGKVVLPTLGDSTQRLDKICGDADAIFGSPFAFAGDIIAEKRAIPFIAGVLQPGLNLSAYDPIYSPQARFLKLVPQTSVGVNWNKGWINLIKLASRTKYGGSINRVRRAHGLRISKSAPFLNPNKVALIVSMYSDVLGGVQPDYYPNTHITGFPVFDSDRGAPEKLDTELEAFIERGPPPLIFTLGSLAVHAANDFYELSQRLTLDLSQRAILLTGADIGLPLSTDIAVRPYLPHSQVFARCAGIVHHGGIGTTGQALISGRPQLVVPHLGDQWDNGARIERLGVGLMLDAKDYNYRKANGKIENLINNQAIIDKAKQIGKKIENENGAQNAASLISDTINSLIS